MGLRESLNRNPGIAIGVVVAIIVIALGIGWLTSSGGGGGARGGSGGEPRRFYTVDDGKTWFADDYDKIPPFDKDGKPAVIARVFRDLDHKGDPFVGFLQRYTPEGKKMLEDQRQAMATGAAGPMEGIAPPSEYKRPGEANWIRSTDPRAAALINEVRSPPGGTNLEEVFPD